MNFARSLTPISYVPLGRLLIINLGFLDPIELKRGTIYDASFSERTAPFSGKFAAYENICTMNNFVSRFIRYSFANFSERGITMLE